MSKLFLHWKKLPQHHSLELYQHWLNLPIVRHSEFMHDMVSFQLKLTFHSGLIFPLLTITSTSSLFKRPALTPYEGLVKVLHPLSVEQDQVISQSLTCPSQPLQNLNDLAAELDSISLFIHGSCVINIADVCYVHPLEHRWFWMTRHISLHGL